MHGLTSRRAMSTLLPFNSRMRSARMENNVEARFDLAAIYLSP
jgi:hypothetical protein